MKWSALWIGFPQEDPSRPAYFRREFRVDKPVFVIVRLGGCIHGLRVDLRRPYEARA